MMMCVLTVRNPALPPESPQQIGFGVVSNLGSRADEIIMVELQSHADKKMTRKEKKRMAAVARREEGLTKCKGCKFDGRKMS